jgi:hypothetical protein
MRFLAIILLIYLLGRLSLQIFESLTQEEQYESRHRSSTQINWPAPTVSQEPSLERTHSPRISINPDRLGDGCYHIFLDAGSNKGVHGRFVFEPQLYPKSQFVAKLDRFFGTHREKQNICVFSFEPNYVKHNQTQLALQQAYRNMGWRYHYLPYALSDHAGKAKFYRNLDYVYGATSEEWGFGAIFHGNTSIPGNKRSQCVKVTLIDFSQWIQKHIVSRHTPPPNPYNKERQPMVVLKLDVEGSEHSTLHHLLKTGVYCQLNFVVGELHPSEIPQTVGRWNLTHRIGDLVINTTEAMQKFHRSLLKRMGRCGTRFEHFDEEKYLHDGMPLPRGPGTNYEALELQEEDYHHLRIAAGRGALRRLLMKLQGR